MCAFCVSLGVYAGENIYKDKVELSEQRYENVQTIAVVNLDEGVDVNGKKLYYSTDLITPIASINKYGTIHYYK